MDWHAWVGSSSRCFRRYDVNNTQRYKSRTSQQEWRSRARGMMLPTDFTPHIGCTIEKEETSDLDLNPETVCF